MRTPRYHPRVIRDLRNLDRMLCWSASPAAINAVLNKPVKKKKLVRKKGARDLWNYR
jgi:hypothetical protein